MVLLRYSTASATTNADTANAYSDTTIHGWKVYVSKSLCALPTLLRHTDSALDGELTWIEGITPAESISELKDMPIWLELDAKDGNTIQYHFLDHRLNDSRKVHCIEIQAADYLNLRHDSLPLFYWLAGAYHQRALGWKNKEIEDAFNHAKLAQLYSVDVRGKNSFQIKNSHDYFAVLSAAYFAGGLSFPPYNATRLRDIDPMGFNVIEKMWKVGISDPIVTDTLKQMTPTNSYISHLGAMCTIRFVNRLNHAVEINWVDYNGARKSYGIIAPGAVHMRETFVSHPFIISGENGNDLMEFIATKGNSLAVIR